MVVTSQMLEVGKVIKAEIVTEGKEGCQEEKVAVFVKSKEKGAGFAAKARSFLKACGVLFA